MNYEEISEEQTLRAAKVYAAKLLKRGFEPEQVEAMLANRGLDQQTAANVVSDLTGNGRGWLSLFRSN